MSFFLYYFFHSAWNQLRRLIRTWAFTILIVFFTIGGLAVFAVRWYYRYLTTVEGLLPEDFMEFFEVEGLGRMDALELCVGLIILGILVIQIIGAEKSVNRVFMQADVNLLFASPFTPQTVLIFRVLTTLGMAFAALIFLLFRIPAFMGQFGLSFYGALSIPLAWTITLAFSVLIKIMIYELGSRHPFLRKNLRWIVFAILGIMGLIFYNSYKKSEEQSLLLSAHRFLNAPSSRMFPVWGWIKGFLINAVEGNFSQSLSFLFLCLALMLLLIWLVRRLPADYYEDVLTRTEEIARLIEDYSKDGVQVLSTVLSQRDRKLRLADFHYGQGSSVYFFKVMHNRFRFSYFYIFTRTGFSYLFVAVAAGLYNRFLMDKPLPYLPVLLLAVMVIFRTVFSPVTEDIRKAFFLMQPGSIWGKLFFSLLGGSCNCVLDALIPLMAASLISGFSPFHGILYLPVLFSVDFFAATAGAFVEVSLPKAIGVTFRQLIQILLLYLGLIFDGMVLVSGIADGRISAGFWTVTAANLFFGFFFLGLTGVWLYPCSGRPVKREAAPELVKSAKKSYAAVGLSLALMYLSIHLFQYIFGRIQFLPPLFSLYMPIYGIGLLVFIFVNSRFPEQEGRADKAFPGIGIREFLLLIPVCFFVMYAGSAAGNILQGFLHFLKPFSLPFPMAEPVMDAPLLQAFFLVTISPLMEEYVFRRCVMDRVLRYGERTAICASALLFGLFHGTLVQLCYGFMLGLVFGYVYCRTGKLRYSIILHVFINILSTVVLPALLLNLAQSDGILQRPVAELLSEPGVVLLLFYLAFLFAASLLGAVLFIFGLRELKLPRDGVSMKSVFSTWGMILFLLISCTAIYAAL